MAGCTLGWLQLVTAGGLGFCWVLFEHVVVSEPNPLEILVCNVT